MEKEKKRFNWKVFIICLAVIAFVALLGSFYTSKGTSSSWYQEIKPSITPPNYVFPIAWNILFFLIALSLYFGWQGAQYIEDKKEVFIIYGVNFLLNVLWSAVYFGMRNPEQAFYGLGLLWISIVYVMIKVDKYDRKSVYLLIPYLAWVSFAGVLNYLSAF